jgi:hypothetical protein
LPAEWSERFSRAFSEALPYGVPEDLTPEQAEELVAQAQQDALAAVQGFAVHLLLDEAKAARRRREQQEMDRERAAREQARIEREGYAALTKLFGEDIAKQVELFSNYQLVREWVGEKLYAVPDLRAEEVLQALNRAGGNAEFTARAGPGYRLGKVAEPLEMPIAAVVNGPEALDQAVATLERDLARQHDDSQAEADRRAKELAAVRARDAERRTYGTDLDR